MTLFSETSSSHCSSIIVVTSHRIVTTDQKIVSLLEHSNADQNKHSTERYSAHKQVHKSLNTKTGFEIVSDV